MKENRFLYAVWLVSFPFLFSCQGGPRNAGRDLKNAEFPLYTIEKNIVSPERRGHISVSLALLALPEQADLSPLLKGLLYEGMDSRQYADRRIASLEELSADLDRTSGELGREEVQWEYTETFTLITDVSDPDILAISRDRDYYLGGAHGTSEKQYFTISRSRGAELGPGDFVPPEKDGVFLALIEDALREYSGIGPGAPLGAGGFFEDALEEIPDNFYPGRNGMVFRWDPYEIAPYSTGPIEVTVSWEKIRSLP
ncbi:MAG: DUF3298 and DUF4163 domain-containing protein [Treponema sp.]|jgi:hypothetical protein|nr:DUF3298 and DUF4163 domain-containing protein [Treponema sp.]